jgi:hypothetical protein
MNTLNSVLLKLRFEEKAARRKWLSLRKALRACHAIDRRGQTHTAESRHKISVSQRRRWAERKTSPKGAVKTKVGEGKRRRFV